MDYRTKVTCVLHGHVPENVIRETDGDAVYIIYNINTHISLTAMPVLLLTSKAIESRVRPWAGLQFGNSIGNLYNSISDIILFDFFLRGPWISQVPHSIQRVRRTWTVGLKRWIRASTDIETAMVLIATNWEPRQLRCLYISRKTHATIGIS